MLSNLISKFKKPSKEELEVLNHVYDKIQTLDSYSTADEFQTAIFTVGKESAYKENIKDFFKLIYEVVFGQDNGPRLGSFIKIYTKDKTLNLIKSKLK